MSRDVTTSLESEYEPARDETDRRAVVGSTGCHVSDKPLCESTGDATEMEF
ncbi:hypothetical protein [Halorussus halobius]|uniref:hypothetical protein n=1 Tax=Halorussus halobius TaxID=1710537 RepID=UPI00143D57CA|nr:hypothetical protein [Halorussus halobius]